MTLFTQKAVALEESRTTIEHGFYMLKKLHKNDRIYVGVNQQWKPKETSEATDKH